MHILKNSNPQHQYHQLAGKLLESVDSELHLGVTMDKRLNFERHIKNSLIKANKRIAWISSNIKLVKQRK